MEGAKVKETMTKSLGKMSDEMMDNGLRTQAKLRANYSKEKGNRYNRQTLEGLGGSGKG